MFPAGRAVARESSVDGEQVPDSPARPNGPGGPVAEGLLALQQTAGNRAVSQLVGQAPLTVQREPLSPANPFPAPAVPQTPTGPPPDKQQDSGGGLGAWLDGSKKIKFRVGSHNLYNAQAGKQFGWSTEPKSGIQGPAVPLMFGLIPMPPPVGPIEIQLSAGVSTYAGGNAVFDVTLQDVILEATVADLLQAGVGAAALLSPMPLVGLGLLAQLKLQGEATLQARARVSASAGVDAFIKGLFNSAVWPIAAYAKGSLGAQGSISTEATFDRPTKVEFSLGRLHLAGGSYRADTRLTAMLGLHGGLAVGVEVGYGPAKLSHDLWRVDATPSVGIDLHNGIEGGGYATLTAQDDGIPVVDLEPILINGKKIIEELFGKRNPGNDVFRPFPPGQAPAGQPPAVLELPAVKAHQLARYRSLLGELHHIPGRNRETDQRATWVASVRGEIHQEVYERAIDLDLLAEPGDTAHPPTRDELFNRARRADSPVLIPHWSRTRIFATAMGVDHIVEYQVYPIPAVDEPWNFELLDPSSNSSAGSSLSANINRLRATLPPEWQDKMLVFTDVTAPTGRLGETWSHDDIVNGVHLDAYAALHGPHQP